MLKLRPSLTRRSYFNRVGSVRRRWREQKVGTAWWEVTWGKTGRRSGDIFIFFQEFCFLYISGGVFTTSTFGSCMYLFLGSVQGGVQGWRQKDIYWHFSSFHIVKDQFIWFNREGKISMLFCWAFLSPLYSRDWPGTERSIQCKPYSRDDLHVWQLKGYWSQDVFNWLIRPGLYIFARWVEFNWKLTNV